MLFCPPGDSTKRFFLSRNFARPFNFRAGGNGIRTHDTIFLYVDLANQCLKPLSHPSKLLIGILCAPEGLSDPINFESRSALARVLFLYLWARLYPDPPSIQAIQICHSLGEAFLSMKTPPLNDELCQSSPPTRPGEKTGSSQALTRLNWIHISFVWSRREGRKPGELDRYSSITLRRSPFSSWSIHVLP